jgi:hypothetical protein
MRETGMGDTPYTTRPFHRDKSYLNALPSLRHASPLIVPDQDGRNTKHLQGKSLVFVALAILVTISGAIIWILSILDVLHNSWPGIIGAIFTTMGLLLTLIQSYMQFTTSSKESPALHPTGSSRPPQGDSSLLVNRRKGALRVKVCKQLRGTTINLYRGFNQIDQQPAAASNIILQFVNRQRLYVGDFLLLEPGNYTVSTATKDHIAQVTLYANRITEIDWR